MKPLRRLTSRTGWPCRILLALLIVASCSKRPASSGSALDKAVVLYISGRYAEARDRLLDLTRSLGSERERSAAYLYLGRCYEALGDFEAAKEAFSTGWMISEDAPLFEHLQEIRNITEADPAFARRQPSLTRAQLACLISRMFHIYEGPASRGSDRGGGGMLGVGPAANPGFVPSDIGDHWAKDSIERVMLAGVMRALPDSLFHPEEKVTWASFYFVARRLEAQLPMDPSVEEDPFPGGLQPILRAQLTISGEATERALITGGEVVTILESLLRRGAKPNG